MPQSPRIFSFALLLPVYHLFDYEVSPKIDAKPGQRFLLPFANTQKLGILLSSAHRAKQDLKQLKSVKEQLDSEPLLSSHLLELARWIADYYCQPIGEVVFLFVPRYCRQARVMNPTCLQTWFARPVDPSTIEALEQKAPRQFHILRALLENPGGLNAVQLREIQSAWHQQVKALQKKDLVSSQWQENLPVLSALNSDQLKPCLELTTQQKFIRDEILPLLSVFQVHLIQGVTGSGKTEIYVELMQRVIEMGKQVIYLVPEIGLTPQLISRIQFRLGNAVVSSHSAQTDYQRYQSWDQCKRNVAKVLIGTRSALFTDMPELGLIIIDEEHDASFRQQDGIRYHARDVAIKRAQMLDVPIVLGSATPSVDSLHNLEKAHYRLHLLEQRPNQSLPPPIELIDCKNTPLNTGCSPPLLKAIEKHLSNQGQVLLFLNRRGYAPVIMCHGCGWQANCYQCDARMTLHQSVHKLICHHCGYNLPVPEHCPDCGESEIRHYGIGTQQLEEFLQNRFPQVETIRIDRDSVKSSKQVEQKLAPVQRGEPCILVGTQMLAKGHDYPNITLVGILDADQALFSSFYRAPERLVQTVLQVSGRAGRATRTGQALLQTAFPLHPLMQNLCVQSYSELVQDLMQERKILGFPPYARVVTLVVDAMDLEAAMQRLQKLVKPIQQCSAHEEIKLVGPIPALMTRRVGRYRAQLSVMANDIRTIRIMLHELMPKIIADRNTHKSRLVIEVDPLDL